MIEASKSIVIALLGPTASGKTDLGIAIAEKLKLSIHNVDSRQIYIDMDIGTAKPTQEQQEKITHYLIDLWPPNKPVNLQQFQHKASLSIEENLKKYQLVFLVGGSGLYLQSLIGRLSPPLVPPQPVLRKQLNELTQKECHGLLKNCDPVAAERIHPKDSIRMIRALEVFYSTGIPITCQQKLNPPPWKVLELGLNPINLHERILQRTIAIYKNGLIEETESLINKYGIDLPLLKTMGYGEARSIIQGELSKQEAIKITTQRTTQFAKRQKTWFKNKHNPNWLNDENPLEEALCLIEEVLK